MITENGQNDVFFIKCLFDVPRLSRAFRVRDLASSELSKDPPIRVTPGPTPGSTQPEAVLVGTQ